MLKLTQNKKNERNQNLNQFYVLLWAYRRGICSQFHS